MKNARIRNEKYLADLTQVNKLKEEANARPLELKSTALEASEEAEKNSVKIEESFAFPYKTWGDRMQKYEKDRLLMKKTWAKIDYLDNEQHEANIGPLGDKWDIVEAMEPIMQRWEAFFNLTRDDVPGWPSTYWQTRRARKMPGGWHHEIYPRELYIRW